MFCVELRRAAKVFFGVCVKCMKGDAKYIFRVRIHDDQPFFVALSQKLHADHNNWRWFSSCVCLCNKLRIFWYKKTIFKGRGCLRSAQNLNEWHDFLLSRVKFDLTLSHFLLHVCSTRHFAVNPPSWLRKGNSFVLSFSTLIFEILLSNWSWWKRFVIRRVAKEWK